MSNDEKYMRMAIRLAEKAQGRTSPNPVVGAVIVKNNRIVGRGYHKKAGLPHAEVNALKQAGKTAKGATLYVSLEPCDHFGRTAPCTDAIIKSGIKKVIIGMKDPNPLNNGKGIKKLKDQGIKVVISGIQKEAESINRPYLKFITKRLPFITVKVAQSLDGKIATKTGDSKWISSEDSRRYVHWLRSRADAVMVGANTVIRDDPLLLSKLSKDRQPARIIINGNSRIPAKSKIFFTSAKSPVMLASSILGSNEARGFHSSERNPAPRIPRLKAGGVGRRDKRVDLIKLLEILAKNGIMHILVEGGGELISSLIGRDLVDRMIIFIAPKVIGGRRAITSVEGSGVARVKDAFNFKIKNIRRFKKDIMIEAER